MSANRLIRSTAHLALRLRKQRTRSFCVLIILGVITATPIISEVIFLLIMEQLGKLSPFTQTISNLDPIVYASTIGRVVLSILMVTPLSYGVKLWYCEISTGNPHSIYEVFGLYTKARLYFKAILLRTLILFRRTVAALTLTLPIAMVMITLELVGEGSGNSGKLLILTACIIIIGIVMAVFVAMFCMRYFLAPYIMMKSPNSTVHKAIAQSVRIMKGEKGKAFTFMFSLYIRIPLCFLIVPAFFILPHIHTSIALYAVCLIEGNAKDIAKAQEGTAQALKLPKSITVTQVFETTNFNQY